MMGKQWLREYMRWTKTSFGPEDLVFLRQIRFEAFMGWNVPAIISSIPALLEVSLLLFLAGLVVLLWTLNGIVAGVCTGFVSAVTFLTIVTTVLPAMFPRCPYKTPMGWALVLFGRAFVPLKWLLLPPYMIIFTILLIVDEMTGTSLSTDFGDYYDQIDPRSPSRRYKDWRDRDLGSYRSPIRASDIVIPMLDAKTFQIHDLRDLDSRTVKGLEQNYTLFIALSWIRQTSQDPRLIESALHCLGSRGRNRLPNDWARLSTDMNMACKFLDIDRNLFRPLFGDQCALLNGWPIVRLNWSLPSLEITGGVLQKSGKVKGIALAKPSLDLLQVHGPSCADSIAASLASVLETLCAQGSDVKIHEGEIQLLVTGLLLIATLFPRRSQHGLRIVDDVRVEDCFTPIMRVLYQSDAKIPKVFIGFNYILGTNMPNPARDALYERFTSRMFSSHSSRHCLIL